MIQTSFPLPVRLGLVNSKGTQDPHRPHPRRRVIRYEVAAEPRTRLFRQNLDVSEKARDEFWLRSTRRSSTRRSKRILTRLSRNTPGTRARAIPALAPRSTAMHLATLGADIDAARPRLRRRAADGVERAPRPKPRLHAERLHHHAPPRALHEGRARRRLGLPRRARDHGRPRNARKRTDNTITQLEHGATPTGGNNNFQGRYAIRHPWGGEIACKNPQYGKWGGPPIGNPGDGRPKPAKDLAFVARDVPLASFVRSDIGELGIKADGTPVTAVIPPNSDAGLTPTGTLIFDAGAGDGGAKPAAPTKSGCRAARSDLGWLEQTPPRPSWADQLGVIARKTRAIPRE